MKDIEEDLRWQYHSHDFYKVPDNQGDWSTCPDCKLKPRVWEFDNGRHAHCVCGKDRYNHTHEVSAKPIGEYVRETGGFVGYEDDDLRKKWNEYIANLKTNHV